MDTLSVGAAIRALRTERGVGLRELCRIAEISPGALSAIENGRSSPTLATFHRILKAVDSDFATFFAKPTPSATDGPVYRNAQMVSAVFQNRQATLVFPRKAGIKFSMTKETFPPAEKQVEWETHEFDIGGVVLSGGPMLLTIDGQGEWKVHAGDAFYVKAGLKHHGRNLGNRTMKLISCYSSVRL